MGSKGLASTATTRQLQNKAVFLWNKFPKFVLGFLLISLLASLGPFIVGALGEIVIAAITLALVLGANHLYRL